MLCVVTLLAFSTAAAAQTAPPVANLDAARAAARQVDQATQAPRTGKESMDRVTPLITVEPHGDAEDEEARRKEKEEEARKALEAAEPQ